MSLDDAVSAHDWGAHRDTASASLGLLCRLRSRWTAPRGVVELRDAYLSQLVAQRSCSFLYRADVSSAMAAPVRDLM